MAASIRSLKRSRISYDDTDPVGSNQLVSASIGMFAASEHWGLYVDTCQLAEVILWGKGERARPGRHFVVMPTQESVKANPNRRREASLKLDGPIELAPKTHDHWESDDGLLQLQRSNDQFILTKRGIQNLKYKLPDAIDDGSIRNMVPLMNAQLTFAEGDESKEDLYLLEVPPPVAVQHLGAWYVFDSPCAFDVDFVPTMGLRCSGLGDQSPVLKIDEISADNGAWPLLPTQYEKWSDKMGSESWPEDMARVTAREPGGRTEVSVYEQASGGGKAFVDSWSAALRMGQPFAVKILWGGVSADFWDRSLNVQAPWAADKLGAFNRGAEVAGSLMETGASMLGQYGLGLATGNDPTSAEESTDKYELVALSSLRFMRDSSVAYPSAIVSFDAGSAGWALEMFDSVSTNAIELVFYMLSGHFQL